MAVTPEVRGFLNMIALADAVPVDELTPAEFRENYARLASMMSKEDVASATDMSVPTPDGDVPVRVYVPAATTVGPGSASGSEPGRRRPVLVYLHGGGWCIGSIETHDNTCRSLANGADVVVVSVDYRLAPEHPFPAGLDDCLAAVRWVVDNADELGVDASRLAIGGDSAGGNLAALAAMRLRDSGPPIAFQLLVYPATDLAMTCPSIEENGEGYFLTKESMVWFGRNYLCGTDGTPRAELDDPRVSPHYVERDALVGLPPALVITAEYDPLRDEGEAYAAALGAAGVDVTVTRYDGVIHGFFQIPDVIPEGKVAIEEACAALRKALG